MDLLVCSFGGLSHAQVCRSLELFAETVIHPRQVSTRDDGGRLNPGAPAADARQAPPT